MARKEAILVVEDDIITLKLIQNVLESNGFLVLKAQTGMEAATYLSSKKICTAILDINLPDINGFEILKEIRKHPVHKDIPILMLTNDSDKVDTVLALEMGADDYITKPFHKREFIARINVALRRARPFLISSGNTLNFGTLVVNIDNREVKKDGTLINLTFTEFELLLLLCLNAGRIFTRDELMDRLWGELYISETRTVDIHISSLRKKIRGDDETDQFIETVRGVGYRFRQ